MKSTLTPPRGGWFDERYRARGYVTRYNQVIVGRIGLRSVSASVTGLFRIAPSRNAGNTRLDTCVHEAKARVHPGVSSLLPRVYTMARTLLVPVSRGGIGCSPRHVCARRQSQHLLRCCYECASPATLRKRNHCE